MKTQSNSIYYIFLFILFGLGSCQPSPTKDPEKYMKEALKNPALHRTVTMKGIVYDFQIITPGMMAIKNATENGTINRSKYEDLLKEYKNSVFVNINERLEQSGKSLLKNDLKSVAEYNRRVEYYEFEASKDIRLESGDKIVGPTSYQYENHQDLVPYNTILLMFSTEEIPEETWSIVFDDQVFNNKMIKATFNSQAIEKK